MRRPSLSSVSELSCSPVRSHLAIICVRRDNTTNNNKNKAISSATTEKRIVEKRRKSARVLCVSIFFSIISVRNVCVFGQCFVGDLRDVFAISWWGIDRVSFFGGDR